MFPMTWLAPESSYPNRPASGTCSTVRFDLAAPETFTGRIGVPADEASMPPAEKIIRAELSFNYVDATVEAGAPPSTYAVRTVYARTATAPDVTGTMQSVTC